MTTTVGYVLVSQVYRKSVGGCGKPGCGDGRYVSDICKPPKLPACRAVCVHTPSLLDQHPECQEYERELAAWQQAHFCEEPTGGTRLGPLHYFRDCHTLNHRGPRRKDARIIELDSGVAEDLGLPVCKECHEKMAPLEQQFAMAPVSPLANTSEKKSGGESC